MFELNPDIETMDEENLLAQIGALLAGQNDRIANAANLSSLLYHAMKDVNWVGFYFLKNEELVVGPFQGKPACVTIPLGRGVCGRAAVTQTPQRVSDVQAFEGHIACDIASRSEIVIPLVLKDNLIGVLDLDSPVTGRFSEEDERFLTRVAERYLDSLVE